jgi:hydrogenase expression/formation protein HypC
MCLGIPGKVISVDDTDSEMPWGMIEFEGIRRKVSLACTPDVQTGDYVIVHAGMAISRVDEAEAARVFELVQTLQHSDGWDEPADPMP